MNDALLTRRLWYLDRDETVQVDDTFLRTDPRPIVVLGEAGMGKSTLLEQFQNTPGFSLCTARKLINSPNPAALLRDSHTLVIDALDEVAVHGDGDAVDLVLKQLGVAGYPRFILSCRVSDWRSATSLQGIADFYDEKALELHLNPLDRSDALAFLARTLGAEKAEETLDYLEARSLAGLWSNPQTLILVETVARQGKLPDSKGDLFAQATTLMLREHREEKAATPLVEMPEDDVLSTAGAAFAALILSGKGALSRRTQVDDDAIALREIGRLPGAARIGDIMASRLFMAKGAERFTYAHRAIGEFLGARWLAETADTPRKRRRLLELFHHQGIVPTSLRGLHAWLAWHSPGLAASVIALDPMGVVEYGDADRLSAAEARTMLKALDALARENPRFRAWSEYRVAGLVQKALLPEVIAVLTQPGVEFGLRMMILQALKGSALVPDLVPILDGVVRDPKAVFATRSEAVDRLAALDADTDWSAIMDGLIAEGTENSIRLASEMMDEVGFDLFTDAQILGVALALLPHSDRTVGLYHGLQTKLPGARIDALLDGLATAAAALPERRTHPGFEAVSDLANSLIVRRLNRDLIAADRLWTWMRPFASDSGYQRSARRSLAEILTRETALRQSIQKLVLLDEPGDRNVWQRAWRLSGRSLGLSPSEEDLIALLDTLQDDDPRWRELVRLANHTTPEGVAVREAAARFTTLDPDGADWMAGLVDPPPPDWHVKDERRRRQRRAKRDADHAKHRKFYGDILGDLKAGHYGSIVQPAKAYLKLFYDIGDDAEDGPGRLREWLGPEIADAALAGFEAFLRQDPPKPTASEMAESFAEDRSWDAGDILAAALAERARTERGFDDLSDERLMAGQFQLRRTALDDHAGFPDLEPTLARILRERGVWPAAQTLYFEPQFARGKGHIDGLYAFMRDADDRDLATPMAIDWLQRYPHVNAATEIELIDHLLTTPAGKAALSNLVSARRARTDLGDDRRQLWDAVGVILRFAETRQALEAAGPVEPDLFWQIRGRQGGSRGSRGAVSLTADQLAWIIGTFRDHFPKRSRPTGVTSGDANAWDASDYLEALINRLGGDASEEARDHLLALRGQTPDGYDAALRVASAEQKRKQVETNWTPPAFSTLAATVTDTAPTTAAQLQAVLIEELAVVQAKIRGSDVDWYKDFYLGSTPKVEDDCRDAILGDDKRIDIICTLGKLMVPIEIKGQWHAKLWSASDEQLDHLYVNDWRAERGIYLVLWFGPGGSKPLTKQPGKAPKPKTPGELQDALVAGSAAARDGRSQVIVLDLTRP